MHPAVIKAVATLLLIVQSAIALAPGQRLCIPVRDCDFHEQDVALACDHHDNSTSSSLTVRDSNCEGYEQGLPGEALYSTDDCGCHLHVLLPDNEQMRSNLRSDNVDLKLFFGPVAVAPVLTWDCVSPRTVVAYGRPPDASASDQGRILKTTRLLI